MTVTPEPAIDVRALAGELKERGVDGVELALVLGSGLGAFADRIRDPVLVPFADLAGVPKSSVPGHAGRFVAGELGGVRVLVQQGRVHLYEGWSAACVARAVRSFALLGARGVVLTNAAGGLRAEWPVPALMRIRDHLNLQGRTPLEAGEAGRGTPWDAAFGEGLVEAARTTGITLHEGVYAGLPGPSYETPAEVRHLGALGADAVGMSTVSEALAAHAVGLKVAGVSCISNLAAGITTGPLSHEEVVSAGAEIAGPFCDLLEAAVPLLVERVES